MLSFWAGRDALRLDHFGTLFMLHTARGEVVGHSIFGLITEVAADDLPEAYREAFLYLLDLWRDAHRWDPRAEARATFTRNLL